MGLRKRVRKTFGLKRGKQHVRQNGAEVPLSAITEAETEEGEQVAKGAYRENNDRSVAVADSSPEGHGSTGDAQTSREDRNPSDIVEMDTESQATEPQLSRTRGDQIEEVCSVALSKAIKTQRRRNRLKDAKSKSSKKSTISTAEAKKDAADKPANDGIIDLTLSSSSNEFPPIKEVVTSEGDDDELIRIDSIVSAMSSNSLSTYMTSPQDEPMSADDQALIAEIQRYVRKVHAGILEAVEDDSDNCSVAASVSSRASVLRHYSGFHRTELTCRPAEVEGIELTIEKEFKDIPPKMKKLIDRMVVSAILSKRELLFAATRHKTRPVENRGPDPIEEAMREIEFLPEEPM
jgi:hypothetical protein